MLYLCHDKLKSNQIKSNLNHTASYPSVPDGRPTVTRQSPDGEPTKIQQSTDNDSKVEHYHNDTISRLENKKQQIG